MFDPGAYLWSIDRLQCGKTCSYLATYDYAPLNVPPPKGTTASEWLRMAVYPYVRTAWPPQIPSTQRRLQQLIVNCVAWQQRFKPHRIILPATLITDPRSDLGEYLRWVDNGLEIAANIKADALVSVPISEDCLDAHLDTLLDQLTAREDVKGVYVCVAAERSAPVSGTVAAALLELSYVLGVRAGMEVVVNFADIFGLACLAAGATSFASGFNNKTRRLCFDDFVEEGGGSAFPRFLSLATNAMYRTGQDMTRLRDKGFLAFFDNDKTRASTPLLAALAKGAGASSVPAWVERKNNLAAARAHLIERLTRAATEVTSLGEIKARVTWGLDWLRTSKTNGAKVDAALARPPLSATSSHVDAWRLAFEQFVRTHGLAPKATRSRRPLLQRVK